MKSMGGRALGRAVLVLVGCAVLVAGCTTTSSGGGTAGGPAATQDAVQGTVLTASGSAGTYLTDYQGMALYAFAKDTAGTSTCTGTCASNWPPYTTSNVIPKAGPGVTQNLLSSFTRPDATAQIAYSGHALYTYKGDTAKGDIKGQGVDSDGGVWNLVAPDGSLITAAK